MKRFTGIAALLLTTLASTSFAAAPTLHVTKSVTIHASAERTWDAIKDFGGLNTWHPAVAKDEIVAGKNNEVGAERLLTLGDGGTIHEKLLGHDDKARSFRYSIIEGVLPVSDYSSNVVVHASGKDQSTVTWSGTFKRKNTGDAPAANENDETATTTMGSVYQAGLDNLKKKLEAK
jgi:mxaD protein